MPRIAVRPATLRDLEALVRHRRGMWEDLGVTEDLDAADAVYRRWVRAGLRRRVFMAWVAEAGGAVVGSGALWLQPVQPRPGWPQGLTPYLLSMYTDPAWRGRGIARRIVQQAIAWCRAHGYPRTTLHASAMGRGVYAGLGYERTWEMKLQLRGEPVSRARGGTRRRAAAAPRKPRPARR